MFNQYLINLEAKANEVIKTEEGDFIKDGLLHCKKCGTPKECRVELMGRIISPKCLCKCEVERRAKEKEQEEKQELLERIKKYRKMGFPQSQMEEWTFENDDKGNERLSNMAMRYVNNFDDFYKDGKGLLLYGGVETRKT